VTISRRVARPLLASIFITEGWDAIRRPTERVEPTNPARNPPAEGDSLVPEDPILWVRVNGAVQVGGGVLLAIGKFPRLASLALIGTIVPTTYAGHRFWEEPDDVRRAEQKVQLLKNLGLLGGLILSAVDTDGAPSLGWRTRRRARQVASALTEDRTEREAHALQTAAKAVGRGRRAGRRANRAAKAAARRANATASDVARHAGELATNAKAGAAPSIRQANDHALGAAEEVLDVAGPLISAGLERAGELLEEAFDIAGPYLSAGLERAGDLLARVPDHPSAD
jgi:uncharacterized membrane protein YphA (DoxX/SURF4 family)